MSLPEGKAIYLIAFILPLVLYAQTHRPPSTHPTYCLFMLIIHRLIWSSQNLIYIFVLFLKSMYNLNFSLWKSIICVLFSQRRIPIRMRPFLYLLRTFLNLSLLTRLRNLSLFFLIVQLLKLFPMKNETKSKIWSAVIAAAVSLLTSIAQIFS